MKLLSGIIELKPGWYVQVPYPMTELDFARYRFDPITLGIIAIAATGTAITYQAQRQQGKAAAAQAKTEQAILERNAAAQQAIAEYNAQLAERQAGEEREAARRAAKKFRREGERFAGTQRVQLARGGVLSTEGTPALLLEETIQELEQERVDILKEGFRRGEFLESQAVGLRFGAATEAAGLRFAGAAARARGINIRRGAGLASIGTLLTGAGQIGYMGYQLRTKKGAKPPKTFVRTK